MFNMRIKINPPRNNELRCFFCLHVRTATILLGIWQLSLHIIAFAILALCMRNHQIHINSHRMSSEIEPGNLLPTPLSKTKNDDNPYYLPTTQDGRHVYQSELDIRALATVCTMSITLLMVYGTVKGKATHLLPFFCLLIYDLATTTLQATGYFCYLRSVHTFVNESWQDLPYKTELLNLSPQYLSLLVLSVFVIAMLFKAYVISVVWRCYKYLSIRQQTRSTVHYILRGDETDRIPDPEFLLPDYEAACASFKQSPPPSYQMAMEQPSPPSYLDTAALNPRVHFVVAERNVEENDNETVEVAAAAVEPVAEGEVILEENAEVEEVKIEEVGKEEMESNEKVEKKADE